MTVPPGGAGWGCCKVSPLSAARPWAKCSALCHGGKRRLRVLKGWSLEASVFRHNVGDGQKKTAAAHLSTHYCGTGKHKDLIRLITDLCKSVCADPTAWETYSTLVPAPSIPIYIFIPRHQQWAGFLWPFKTLHMSIFWRQFIRKCALKYLI